jgi:uncharacterized protein YidB (DUF937 family)
VDILEVGSKLLKEKLGGGVDESAMASALKNLLGGSDGKIDLGDLVNLFKSSGLAGLAESWLGDGANQNVSAEQVREAIGGDKIKKMADQIGSEENALLDGLKDVIPQLIDKASSGGSLLDAMGGLGGMASKFLK